MIRNKKVAKALQYSTRNPHAKLADVAEKFGITRAQLYMARYNHGVTNKPTVAKSKKRITLSELAQRVAAEGAQIDLQIQQNTLDMVNHPPHYKAGGIETIDFIEAKGLNYNLGNAVKYITRADLKGDRKENLEKALWYLKRELGV